MANEIPLAEGTQAAGGYLVPEEHVDEILVDGIRRESAVAALAKRITVRGKQAKITTYGGRPVAGFVDEGASKPVTGASFGQTTINIKKIAATVLYTEEMLEDARKDPRAFVNVDVQGAFADLIDAHALGMAAGAAIVGNFDAELVGTSQTVELGSGGDAFALAVSQAMEKVEANGYRPSGVAAASDIRGHLRDSRHTVETAMPVYTAGFNREPDSLYGLPIAYTSNLDALPAGSGKVAAIVADWQRVLLAMRMDVTVRVSTEATIDDGAETHLLFQQNKTAYLWEMRLGLNVHDLNRAVCAITNGS